MTVTIISIGLVVVAMGFLAGRFTVILAKNHARITGFVDCGSESRGTPAFVEVKGVTYRLVNPDEYVGESTVNKVCSGVREQFKTMQEDIQEFILLEKKVEKEEALKNVAGNSETETKEEKRDGSGLV